MKDIVFEPGYGSVLLRPNASVTRDFPLFGFDKGTFEREYLCDPGSDPSAGTTTATASTGTTGTGAWAGKTATEIMAELDAAFVKPKLGGFFDIDTGVEQRAINRAVKFTPIVKASGNGDKPATLGEETGSW